jgi:tetratricopeptide (TPR) repeat protein
VSSSPAQAQVTPAPVEKDKPAEKEKRADKDKPVEPPAARAPDLFKLAQSIDTPIERLVTPEPQKNATREPSEKPPAPRPLQVVKRERPTTPEQKADAAFRRGVAQMNAARISEAQASFAAALEADPAHVASRQALVAILLERGDMDTAQALLQRGLELRPGDVRFATVLARILVEREEFERAAEVLASCPDGAGHLEHQMLYGAVLQRLGRHTQALHAFENAQRLGAPPSATLVAMGVSYERLGQTADAVRVYQQSLTAQAPDEVRLYAEGRIRALR